MTAVPSERLFVRITVSWRPFLPDICRALTNYCFMGLHDVCVPWKIASDNDCFKEPGSSWPLSCGRLIDCHWQLLLHGDCVFLTSVSCGRSPVTITASWRLFILGLCVLRKIVSDSYCPIATVSSWSLYPVSDKYSLPMDRIWTVRPRVCMLQIFLLIIVSLELVERCEHSPMQCVCMCVCVCVCVCA